MKRWYFTCEGCRRPDILAPVGTPPDYLNRRCARCEGWTTGMLAKHKRHMRQLDREIKRRARKLDREIKRGAAS